MTGQTLRRIARHLRSQWAGLLTIFLVLTAGAAYALPGMNTVYSNDIVDGQVGSVDVADGSITGSRDVRTLDGSDLERNTLSGAQVDEPSVGVIPVAAQAGTGVGGSGGCRESTHFVDCGALGVTIAKPGRLLIIAAVRTSTYHWDDDVYGPCRLEVDHAPIEVSETYFRYDDEGELAPWNHDPAEGAGQQATLTAVSHVYGAGRHVVGVECSLQATETFGDGNVVYVNVDISAVGLSDR